MSQLQLVLQKVLDAVVVMRRDGTVADWNGCAEQTFGWTRAEALDRSMNDLIVPAQHREAHARGLQRYLATGEAVVVDRRIEISGLHKSGREFPVELTITEADFGGEIVFIGFLRDISERKAAERALKESEARLAATYNHALVGIAEVDAAGRFVQTNEQFCRLTGYEPDELRSMTLFEITHPEDVEKDAALFEQQWSGEIDGYRLEKRYVRKDGKIIWIELAASIVRADPEASSYGVRIIRDVTDRKIAQEHQQLLIAELSHRVKNTLTIVQALAQQTFRAERVPSDLMGSFQGRLSALAKAHDLLFQQRWTPTPISRIVEEAVRPFRDQEGRFSLSGGDVLLPPQSAVTLSLAIHELATNAAKYGALSTAEGAVSVGWATDDGRFELVWRENGGPPVSRPERRGFGTRMLEQAFAREVSGTVHLDYAPDGLVCRISAPLPSQEGRGAP